MDRKLQEEWKGKSLSWLERIQKYIQEEDMPDVIVAHAIASFYHLALGYMGKTLWEQEGAWLLSEARTFVGLCKLCDNRIKPSQDLCESCLGKLTGEAFKIEMEYPEEEGS